MMVSFRVLKNILMDNKIFIENNFICINDRDGMYNFKLNLENITLSCEDMNSIEDLKIDLSSLLKEMCLIFSDRKETVYIGDNFVEGKHYMLKLKNEINYFEQNVVDKIKNELESCMEIVNSIDCEGVIL